jgi:hypothetical protein
MVLRVGECNGAGCDLDMTKQTIMETCDRILEVHESVRHVYVLGLDGTELYSIGKGDISRNEPEDATPGLFVKMAIGLGMAESQNRSQGRLKSIVVNREKLKIIIQTGLERILMVFTAPEFPVDQLVRLEELVGALRLDGYPAK